MCRSDICVYFNVNFKLFPSLINSAIVGEWTIYISECKEQWQKLHEVTTMTNTVKVTKLSLFPMLAAIFLVSIATWNLHYFKPALIFQIQGLLFDFAFHTSLYRNSLPKNSLYLMAPLTETSYFCGRFQMLTGGSASMLHSCRTWLLSHKCQHLSQHPAVIIFYTEGFSEGCTPIHRVIQYDNRKWFVF